MPAFKVNVPVAVPVPLLVWPLPTTIVSASASTVPPPKSTVPDDGLLLTLCAELSPMFSADTRSGPKPRRKSSGAELVNAGLNASVHGKASFQQLVHRRIDIPLPVQPKITAGVEQTVHYL